MNLTYTHQDNDSLLVAVDLGIHDTNALLKVAHRFTDRCYVHLAHVSPSLIEARFKQKEGSSTNLAAIIGEFCNELLDQSLRSMVARETERERDLILALALSRHPLLNPDALPADDRIKS